jgi:hypothetical protein
MLETVVGQVLDEHFVGAGNAQDPNQARAMPEVRAHGELHIARPPRSARRFAGDTS